MLKIHSDMTSRNLWIDLKDDVASSHVSLRSILPEELTLEMPQVTQHKCVFTFFCISIPRAHVSFNLTSVIQFYCLMHIRCK